MQYNSAYPPELPVTVGGRGGREQLRPEENDKEVSPVGGGARLHARVCCRLARVAAKLAATSSSASSTKSCLVIW